MPFESRTIRVRLYVEKPTCRPPRSWYYRLRSTLVVAPDDLQKLESQLEAQLEAIRAARRGLEEGGPDGP
jgi:hypothetical protein